MASVIYAVYGEDIECPGMIKVFAKKEDAQELIKRIEEYESNTQKPVFPDAFSETFDDEMDAFMAAMEIWESNHPLEKYAGLYDRYFISEIDVF